MAGVSVLLLFSYILLNCSYLSFADEEEGKLWVVCVAGYNFYRITYSFESGIYKACKLFSGLDDERLIIISPDVAAYHPNNALANSLIFGPFPGNTYSNVNVTYNSRDVTTKLFYDILKGDEEAVKGIGQEKVLKSGPQDTVVLMFINIGIYGIMTLTNKQFLFPESFIPFLEELSENNKFKKMLILADGEEVASFFDGYLDRNSKILAMTNGGKGDHLDVFYGNYVVNAYTTTCFTLVLLEELQKLIIQKTYEQTTFYEFFQKIIANRVFPESVPNLYGQLELGALKMPAFFGSAEKLTNAFKVIDSVHVLLGEK